MINKKNILNYSLFYNAPISPPKTQQAIYPGNQNSSLNIQYKYENVMQSFTKLSVNKQIQLEMLKSRNPTDSRQLYNLLYKSKLKKQTPKEPTYQLFPDISLKKSK
ncbi:Hypothetical_protein [Hexamita inflata]|uniref:Hypothetical_protein n=1 Tax=Hexamita inflata TaxID=28002 RepID=A0AA86PKS0_9EUKA|nr:Hypothetical protein HINF_LOCUS24639 [Hexamita inflata]